MAADGGAALVDARLLGRPRSYSGNSQEWNAVKFVFKSYIGVVAHPMLAAMIHMQAFSRGRTSLAESVVPAGNAQNSPCPERTGLLQSILQFKFSPGFDKLEDKRIMRSSVKKQSSSHRCLLRSELTWNCRLSNEPQISSISCQACPR